MPITAMLGVDARFETNEVLTRLIGDLLQPVSVMDGVRVTRFR